MIAEHLPPVRNCSSYVPEPRTFLHSISAVLKEVRHISIYVVLLQPVSLLII